MSAPPIFLAAAFENVPGPWDDLVYATLGLLVVMFSLAGMTFLLYGTGALFRRFGVLAQNKAIEPASQAIPEPPTGLEPQIVAAIAGAVQATVLAPYRIVTITALPPAGNWSAEGRRQQTTSHRVR